MVEKIHAEIVRGWSPEDSVRFPIERFQHVGETGSTNDDLLARARSGSASPYDLISADFQSRGRGRRGDRWEATPGRNLLFSLALPLEGDRHLWPRLPHLTAWIVGSTVESILGPGYRLEAKWPNDLLHDGKKLAGILVEIVLAPVPYAIVGIGLNVNLRQEELPPELRSIATSLYELIGCESSRWFLLGQIIQGFLRHFPAHTIDFDPVLDWIRPRDFLAGRLLSLRSGREWFEGHARGIGADGELLLETLAGDVVKIVSAEEIRRE
ncbi:MAG: biotin--[acetyl-CoA-carboxylase] ligase [Verrucomicrobiales bacterium]|nr:biotin--[acetyl-CoA-carboxylase] ligase [Verrucomicrobiales bacterium]